ncbi:cell division protein, partial [Chryseobacterium piscium]
MKEQRPPIPDPMARKIRQRCGFGCVICGCPIYEYEHMEEWAKVKRHVADEITLLCHKHHGMKTRKLLPSYIVIEANKNPYNYREGNTMTTSEQLPYEGSEAIIVLGDNTFIINDKGDGTKIIPIMITGKPLIEVTLLDNRFLLNILLFDDFNNIILKIENNIICHYVGVWDIEYIANNLIIRQGFGRIFVDIK